MTGKRNLLVPPEGGVSAGLPPFQRRGHRRRQQWATGRKGTTEQSSGFRAVPGCHALHVIVQRPRHRTKGVLAVNCDEQWP